MDGKGQKSRSVFLYSNREVTKGEFCDKIRH